MTEMSIRDFMFTLNCYLIGQYFDVSAVLTNERSGASSRYLASILLQGFVKFCVLASSISKPLKEIS